MKRALIQLDEATHRALRKKAYAEHRSMSSIVREALARELGAARPSRKRGEALLSIIGIARDRHDPARPMSTFHDEYWAEALENELKANVPPAATRRPRRHGAKR